MIKNMTIHEANESCKFGCYITHDADKDVLLVGSVCSHCGKYFEDDNYNLHCKECRKQNKI